jgi:hypothetical protein
VRDEVKPGWNGPLGVPFKIFSISISRWSKVYSYVQIQCNIDSSYSRIYTELSFIEIYTRKLVVIRKFAEMIYNIISYFVFLLKADDQIKSL